MPLFIRAWLDEEFHLHLFEFARAENEVSRSDFVAERLSNLADSKWRLHTSCAKDVGKVYEDALGGFRAKVVKAFFSSNRAQEGL